MFFGCYLLVSSNSDFKNHTYIGFTVNPTRRLKQHNGQMAGGAFKTFRKRPWCALSSLFSSGLLQFVKCYWRPHSSCVFDDIEDPVDSVWTDLFTQLCTLFFFHFIFGKSPAWLFWNLSASANRDMVLIVHGFPNKFTALQVPFLFLSLLFSFFSKSSLLLHSLSGRGRTHTRRGTSKEGQGPGQRRTTGTCSCQGSLMHWRKCCHFRAGRARLSRSTS